MYKRITLISLSILLYLFSFSQRPVWRWVQSSNASGPEGFDVAAGVRGDAYITGSFMGSLVFGPVTLNASLGNYMFYIAHFDSSGGLLWAKAGGPQYGVSSGVQVVTDASGNAYVAGLFNGDSLGFGDGVMVYNASGEEAGYMVKYSSVGQVLWARSITCAGNAESYALATDKYNNVYLTGDFYCDTLVIGPYTLLKGAGPGDNLFIAKYDNNGNVLWAKSAGGDQFDFGTAVATDQDANVILTGNMSSASVTFSPLTINNQDYGISQIFIAKLDSAGNGIWGKTSSGTGTSARIWSAAADGNNSIYLTGYYEDYLEFDTLHLASAAPGGGQHAFFLLKYDAAGPLDWYKNSGGYYYHGDHSGADGYKVATDTDNNVYVSGGFFGILPIDTPTLTAPWDSADPMFVLTMDSLGNIICAAALTSGGDDQNGIAPDGRGNVFICSDYETNPFVIGHDTLPANPVEQVFIAKYTCGSATCNIGPISIKADTQLLCPGDSAHLCAPLGYSGYQWSNGATTNCISAANAGNYYVTVTQSGCNAVSSPVSIVVYQPMLVAITVSGTDSLLSIDPGPYVWYRNDSVIPGANQSLYIAPQPGSYTVQVTDSNGCREISNPVVVDSLPCIIGPLSLTVDSPNLCPGDSAHLCVTAGYTSYQWSNGATTNCISTANAGNYYVTVTQGVSCSAVSSPLAIAVYSPTSVAITVAGGDSLICDDPGPYLWFHNGAVILDASQALYVAAQPGTYAVQVTDSNGCRELSNPVIVATGIAGLAGGNISIYPNPTRGTWYLATDASLLGALVQVFSESGKLVYKTQIESAHQEISIDGAGSGVYELRITGRGNNFVTTLVKL